GSAIFLPMARATFSALLGCSLAVLTSGHGYAAVIPDSVEHLFNLNNECWQSQRLDESGIHWVTSDTSPPETNREVRNWLQHTPNNIPVSARGSSIHYSL